MVGMPTMPLFPLIAHHAAAVIDIEMVRESVFIRAALEGSIAETLAQNGLSVGQLAALKTILRRHEQALAQKDIRLVYSCDFELHQQLSLFSGYTSLWRHVEQYRIHN